MRRSMKHLAQVNPAALSPGVGQPTASARSSSTTTGKPQLLRSLARARPDLSV